MNTDIDRIKIPPYMYNNPPSKAKIENRIRKIQQAYYLEVTVDSNNTLIDGYATYLAYKRLGYLYCPVAVKTRDEIDRHNSINQLQKIYEYSNGCCYICGRKCLDYKTKDTTNNLYPTVDHIIPLCKGGSNNLDNKRLACTLCNNLKGQFSYSESLVQVIRQELMERGLL